MLEQWVNGLDGERLGPLLVQVSVEDQVVKAWNVSETNISLLPMWAKRCDVLLMLGDSAVSQILEEMLPSMHPLSVVALADAATASEELRRESDRRGLIYCQANDSVGLLRALIAQRSVQLQSLLEVEVRRHEIVDACVFYEVRCSFRPGRRDGLEFGWSTPRRYSEFLALRDELSAHFRFPKPRKSLDSFLTKSGIYDHAFFDRRQSELETWLRTLLGESGATGRCADDYRAAQKQKKRSSGNALGDEDDKNANARRLLTFLDPAGHLKSALLRVRTQRAREQLQTLFDETAAVEKE